MSAIPLDQWASEEITRLKTENQGWVDALHSSQRRVVELEQALERETVLLDEQLAMLIKYKNKYGPLPGDK